MKPGDTLDGRYTITERLGAGGMGEVYKATHTFLGSSRVIKVVHPHISGNTDAKDRFLREARAATKIQHPNVATLHDFASLPDGAHYMVWEFIAGENLAQRLRVRGPMPPRQAVRIILQALRGLDAIHRAGIIHRDISPENLMITADDEVKIIDLGVAKVEDTDAVSQTRTGIFVGKLRYAAPEQLGFIPEGEKIDGRADLYAMAMVLVELLTGRPPYEATSPHEYFMLHAVEPRKQTVSLPLEMPGSVALQAVLEKALARDRNQRYATARDFATALEEIDRTLPDARDMATVSTPLDGDATMRVTPSPQVDTLHRDTVRTNASTEPTPVTRPNAPGAAPITLLTPLPADSSATPVATPIAPAPKMTPGLNPAWIVGFVVLIVMAIGALLLWPRDKRSGSIVSLPETTTTAAVTTTTAAPTQPPPQIAEASVTVTSATAESTQLSAPPVITPITTTTAPPPVVTTTVAVKPPTPKETHVVKPPPVKPQPDPDEEPSPEPSVPAFSRAATYRDGGDSDANDRAMAVLRRELRGTTTVALRAGGMTGELARALREQFPSIQFEGEADVVIRFTGRNERLGAGRKRRFADATVEKNGRVIFRYQLPDEVYRVGQSSVEAFANVLGEAFQE
jgi:serine/threonine protein kinase